MRSGWFLACVALTACAEAGKSAGVDSGTGGIDAPKPPIDAPTSSPDAALDAPMANACTSAATCPAAVDLGSISGDTGAVMRTASGHQSAWYKVRVTEDDSNVLGIKLSATVRLTSPAAANYDVFVYVNTGSDVIECTTPSGTLTQTGMVDDVYVIWGEGSISNGNDDGRTISIEVRPINGTCAPATPYQLVVTGNT